MTSTMIANEVARTTQIRIPSENTKAREKRAFRLEVLKTAAAVGAFFALLYICGEGVWW